MTIAIATPPISLATSALQILLEALPDGQFAAWALALPDCRVVADSREDAIEALELRLEERRGAIEVIELPGVRTALEDHPVMKFAGIFKDDPDFVAWHDRFWAEKQQIDDSEELTPIEELMGIL
jgi:hypothetical protein